MVDHRLFRAARPPTLSRAPDVKILVLNSGSSSVKFQLIETDAAAIAGSSDRRLARGQIERIGGEAILTLAAGDQEPTKSTAPIRDHTAAVEHIIGWLIGDASSVPVAGAADIDAVGHRVVHGGERFSHSIRVDDDVRRGLEELFELAPLHNPNNLRGIAAARAVLGPDVPQVAVFDTAFHQSIPETAFLYALPYQLYRRYGVRRTAFTAPRTATSPIAIASSRG
jgi:acetate kinase